MTEPFVNLILLTDRIVLKLSCCCFAQMFMAFTHMVLRAKKQSQNRAEREREREKDTVNINAQRDRDRRRKGKKCC